MNPPRLYVGSGWKMHKTVREAAAYVEHLLERLEALRGTNHIQIFVVPPFTALETVKRLSAGKIWVGAQNMHWAASGAYTGEVSPTMLQELGVDLVELGHAERRRYFHETDADLNRKVQAALAHGLRPLLCVGETLEEREAGVEAETVARQLKIALRGVSSSQAARLLIADEPHWAIGEAGTAADPTYIQGMWTHIRNVLVEIFGPGAGASVPILYGGDVNPDNTANIVSKTKTQGLFIGRAAREAEGFANLIRISIQALAKRQLSASPSGARSRRPPGNPGCELDCDGSYRGHDPERIRNNRPPGQ